MGDVEERRRALEREYVLNLQSELRNMGIEAFLRSSRELMTIGDSLFPYARSKTFVFQTNSFQHSSGIADEVLS